VVSLPDLQKYREWNCYPNRNVFVFTDDDGWIDAYAGLAPIAKKYAVPFSFGIIASRLGAPGFVSAKEVAALARDPLFSIASHSVSHSDQDAISEPAERREICESKIILERLTGKPVAAFVYPAGRMSVNSSKILRECGYDLAFTTHYGAPWKESKTRYDINRTRVYPETKNAFFEKLADFR
jgi:peptidoglycan/xylan/chitin deacetylase (PgdA/CDA1 family)